MGRWLMEVGKGEASHGSTRVGHGVVDLFGLELKFGFMELSSSP